MLEGGSDHEKIDRGELWLHRFFWIERSTLGLKSSELNPVISIKPYRRILTICYKPNVI